MRSAKTIGVLWVSAMRSCPNVPLEDPPELLDDDEMVMVFEAAESAMLEPAAKLTDGLRRMFEPFEVMRWTKLIADNPPSVVVAFELMDVTPVDQPDNAEGMPSGPKFVIFMLGTRSPRRDPTARSRSSCRHSGRRSRYRGRSR